jgi:hypothetical protein
VADGVGRASLVPVTPVVPHLLDPDSVVDDVVRGSFACDVSSSPVHVNLRFLEQCTPNPSAPSFDSQGVEASSSFLLQADQQTCISCNGLFTPRRGENCYGKCDACLESAFHTFAHVHGIYHAPVVSHDVQAAASTTGVGVPPGEPPSQEVVATVGAALVPQSSFFLTLAPDVFCRRCGVAFRPLRGSECNSLCLPCSSLSFLRSPSPKAKRHRKAGPPI